MLVKINLSPFNCVKEDKFIFVIVIDLYICIYLYSFASLKAAVFSVEKNQNIWVQPMCHKSKTSAIKTAHICKYGTIMTIPVNTMQCIAIFNG